MPSVRGSRALGLVVMEHVDYKETKRLPRFVAIECEVEIIHVSILR